MDKYYQLKKNIKMIVLAFVILLLWSCTESFIPDTNDTDTIVVEGYITAGENALPPFVLLSKQISFTDTIALSDIGARLVKDAEVSILHAGLTYPMEKICEIPAILIPAATEILGFDPTTLDGQLCIWVYLDEDLPIIERDTYELEIVAEGHMLSGLTTIPRSVPLIDQRWDEPPGESSDTLARLFISFEEPPGPDYYQYKISTNSGPYVLPFASVTNDVLFENRDFEIPLNNVVSPDDEIDPNTFGLFNVGDTIVLRWLTIDKAHFDFWNTRDFNANSGGPFSSYTRIETNIVGGIGIWGGYYQHDYKMIVED